MLPTGRNLYGVDPRAVPTRTAWEIGRRAADEVLERHARDHGEWPKRIVMDLWASATMRTGGDDLAHALALIGVRPLWDAASSRVAGFEITPLAKLGRARVDVTLRISGLFRDVFPAQIALFDQAVRAISETDEDDDDNPIGAARRATGDAPRAFSARRRRLTVLAFRARSAKTAPPRAKNSGGCISMRRRTPMALGAKVSRAPISLKPSQAPTP